jgi:hypothetical protein
MNRAAKLIIGILAAIVLFGAGYIARQQSDGRQVVYAVFGDNDNVFPPGRVRDPSIVESYTTPALYGSRTCVAPALWISPAAFFSCYDGAWVQTLTP